jgi:hypothetical protein
MARALALLDIQFGERFEPEKARRIAEEIRRLQLALNVLISTINTTPESQEVPAHDLLGTDHTLAGLSVGQVLKAIDSDSAAFADLTLGELGDVDGTATNGQVLTRQADGTFAFSSLPDLSNLTDPGGNRLVYWKDADNLLDYLIIGDGLQLHLGTTLRVNLTAIDHGAITGLGDDDHPQYAGIAQDELVSGAWDFLTPIDFVDPDLDVELRRYRFGVEGDLALTLVDEFDTESDLLRVSRLDGTTVDTLTIGNDSQLRLEMRGSLFLPDDDQSISMGGGGELALYRNEEYAEVTNLTGILHLTSDDGLRLQADLLEVIAPESIAVDAEAYAHAGRWTRALSEGRFALGAYDDEYGGEDFLTVDMDGTEVENVNISGDSFTFNGAEVLALQSTQTTVGAAGGASALPATPVGYAATITVDGVTYGVPYYNLS